MDKSIRLGTRGSALALAQAQLVADLVEGAEIVAIKTDPATGGAAGDKGRFVRGIEEALLAGEVDLGVHSAKDLPSALPDELRLAGVPTREDPADGYVGDASSLDDVARAPGSARRACAAARSCSRCGRISR